MDTTVKDLIQDNRNANAGTVRGQAMIIESIQNNKLGRSIVIDKNNKIIGGNKTAAAVTDTLGENTKTVVVETIGDKLLVHKRLDLDLDDPDPNSTARRLAYQDNLTNYFSFDMDTEQVMADIESGFDFEAIDINLGDLGKLLESELDPFTEWEEMPEFKQEDLTSYKKIIVHFASEDDIALFAELIEQSLTNKTKSVWYPKAKIDRYADKEYTDES